MKSEIFNSSFSDHWITRKLSSNNIKKIAFFLTFILICYHGILHLTSGVKSCKWLLSDGNFHGFGSYRVWQPYGCMLHTYSKVDTRMCIRYIAYWGGHNHIVFMGDSRVRQLYYEFVKSVSMNQDNIPSNNVHHDLVYNEKDLNLNIKFLWRPVVNQSMVDEFKYWNQINDYSRPNIVIVGSATHSIKQSNASLDALEFYRKNLTILLPYMDSLNRTTTILWVLQDPIKHELLKKTRQMITNEQIDAYNKAAMEILHFSNVKSVLIWSSARLVAQGYNDAIVDQDNNDGLHINVNALKFSIQILLNLYCNDHMNYNDGTCCSDPEKFTNIQLIVLLAFLLFVGLSIAFYIYSKIFGKNQSLQTFKRYKWTQLTNNCEEDIELIELKENGETTVINESDDVIIKNDQNLSHKANNNVNIKISKKELLFSLSRLGIIMFYFFLCDRTNFFMKENKYFTRPNFFLPIAYVFALGLFFTDESSHTSVLHRDQTNEMRGWMQLVILAYHYTGASQVLPIYMSIRLLVSIYLFLSGYGHFTYFWTTGDISFNRFFKVIFRLNFLTICLCLCMNRPYQFYYFVPLITFWFVIIFVTFKIIPHVSSITAEANSSHYFYIILKLTTLFSIISLLYTSEVFFENIFLIRPWKALFVNTDDSIKEWWFRWKIDRYSAVYGMVFAFGYQMMKKQNLIHISNQNYLFTTGISVFSVLIAILGVVLYIGFTFFCRNKSDCNEVHPYISFVPIISLILLRNVSNLLRSRYSLLFAWFGRISLELFICQYHIWLAADTHGILVLIPGYPVLNVVITSFIFICIAHEIHLITDKVVHYSITNDWRYTLRNLAIILLILIPVGIKDGMF